MDEESKRNESTEILQKDQHSARFAIFQGLLEARAGANGDRDVCPACLRSNRLGMIPDHVEGSDSAAIARFGGPGKGIVGSAWRVQCMSAGTRNPQSGVNADVAGGSWPPRTMGTDGRADTIGRHTLLGATACPGHKDWEYMDARATSPALSVSSANMMSLSATVPDTPIGLHEWCPDIQVRL